MRSGLGGWCDRTAWFSVLGCAVLAGACTITMYQGPKRPRNETALIETSGMGMQDIDGLNLPVGSRFIVLSGTHSLSAKPTEQLFDSAQSVCFLAEAGRTYEVTRGELDDDWRPAIIDETTGAEVPTTRAIPNGTCAEVNLLVAPPPIDPITSPRPVAAVERSEIAKGFHHHPGTGWSGEIGFVFGGARLVAETSNNGGTLTFHAGEGIVTSMGGMWTPVWVGDSVGMGLGVFAAVKFNGSETVSTGQYTSFPVGGSAHAFVRLDQRRLLLLRGGVEKDLDVSISGTNLSSGLKSMLGEFGEAGVYLYPPPDPTAIHPGLSLTVRYTRISYTSGGALVDASSLGVLVAGYYNL